ELPRPVSGLPLLEEIVLLRLAQAIELGEELAGRALPAPLPRRALAHGVLVGVAELPGGDLAQEHERFAGGAAQLGAFALGEADDDAGRVRIADAPEGPQDVRESLRILRAEGLSGDGLAPQIELALRPLRDLLSRVAARLDERGDAAVTHGLELELGVDPEEL